MIVACWRLLLLYLRKRLKWTSQLGSACMKPRYIALRQSLGRIGLCLSVFVHGLAGGAGLPLDGLAVAEDSSSTTPPIPPVFFPEPADPGRTMLDVFASNRFADSISGTRLVVTGGATGAGRCSPWACPPATASPAARPT
jgi:hypothetical protein